MTSTHQIQHVDLIISAKWILPIVPENTVFEDCSLVINHGTILSIQPSANIQQYFTTDNHKDLSNQLLMPGLINAHCHAAMSLLRGFADDLPLMTWLQEHIWPAETTWVDESFVEDGTELAIAEMLKSGTTCFSDMYFYPEVAANVARKSGIKAQIVFPILDFPTAWANDADEYITKGLKLHDDYRSNERINIGFGPHAPYTVSDEPLKRIAMLSDELQAPIQIHVHETADEVDQAIKSNGARPLKRLFDLGLLTPLTQCVHVTQVNAEDIDILQQSGSKVIHCPESNLKLASGTCPISQLIDSNITVGLGTDGAASNNDLDMFGELTTAAYIAKIQTSDATAINANTALRIATLEGAKALGIDHKTGSLEQGKAADIIAINLDHISCHPIFDVASLLVYNNRHIETTHVWVDGRCLLDQGELTTLNESAIKTKVSHWQALISGATTRDTQ